MDFKIAAFVGALGAGLRALAIPATVGDVDGVNFARALQGFDPLHQAPHLPGYPVYVATTHAAHALGASEAVALALPAVLLWLPAVLLLHLGLRRHLGVPAALGAVAVASLAPGAVLVGGWPGSDGLGLALLVASIGATGLALGEAGPVAKRWFAAAGVLVGLAAGVRLSWAPALAAVLAWGVLGVRAGAPGSVRETARDARRPLLLGAAAGTLAWLVPLAALVGPVDLVRHGVGFAQGHLTTWGGTSLAASQAGLSGPEASFAARAARAAWDVTSAGLGATWPGPIPMTGGVAADASLPTLAVAFGATLALFGLFRTRPRWAAALLLLALPYTLWALFGQNVIKPRHLTPLLPVVGALLGAGFAGLAVGRGRASAALAAATLVALLVVSGGRARTQAAAPAPAMALVQWVTTHHGPEDLQLFAGEEARLFEHAAPSHRTLRPANPQILARAADEAAARGATVWISSGVPEVERLADRLVPIARFEAPEEVRGHDARLVLFAYGPASAPAAPAVVTR